MELLGLTGLPTEEQIALVNKMTEYVQKRIMLRILNELNEPQRQEAERVFTGGTDDQKAAFFKSLPNFEKILQEEVVAVKKELVDETSKLEV